MATLEEELAGGMPPLSIGYTAPDLASLSFPWDAPAPIDPAVAPEPVAVGPEPQPPIPLQPGLGVPLEALETAAPAQPAPELGAPTDAPTAAPAPGAEFGIAPPAPAPEPVVLGPPAPTVEDYVGAPRIETNAERYSNDPLGNPVAEERQAELNRMAVSDPARFAEIVAENDEARRQFADARKLEAINRDHEQQRMNLAARQQADQKTREAMQELLAKSERLAATKLDPTGGVTGVRRIAGVIAAIVGGLYQARTGAARNSGLDALGAAIEQGIASQRAELAAQRDVIGQRGAALNQQFAQNASDFNDDEAVRLAAWKHADDLLAVEQQNFRRGGTTELRIAAERAAIAQRRQQAMTAAEQKRFENEIKLAEVDQKQRAEERAARVAEENARNQRAQIGLGYAGLESAREDRKLARELKADEKKTEREIKREEREHKLAIGTPTPRLKVDEKGNPVLDAKGAPVAEAGWLTQATGDKFLAPDEEARKDLAAKMLGAAEFTDIAHEILAIRRRVGGESKLLNSDEVQRLKVLEARALKITKAATQGMSSDTDIEILRDGAGTNDVASWRDREAGIEKGIEATASELNKALRIAGYTGPQIRFANLYTDKPRNTAADDAEQALLQKPNTSLGESVRREARRRTAGLSPDELRGFGDPSWLDAVAMGGDRIEPLLIERLSPAQRAVYEDVAKTYSPEASLEQQTKIVELAQAARAGDMSARRLLQKVATSAHTQTLQQLAGRELSLLQASETLRTDEPVAAPEFRSTARETVPPIRGGR